MTRDLCPIHDVPEDVDAHIETDEPWSGRRWLVIDYACGHRVEREVAA